MTEKIINRVNINRGKCYQDRVCLGCKGEARDLSNYCQSCFNILKKELLEEL